MKVVLEGVRPWRHDLAGCLHACAATLLAHQGLSPLDALGAAWGFYYPPGDFRQEEYYYPCRPGSSLLSAIAPYHPVTSEWHVPGNAERGWAEVRDQVAAGIPVAVAVDNFELPFRPAYQDVHANHLVVVYGFDDEERTARVLDTVPPRFDGDLPIDVLTAARDSGNEAQHDRDMFFAESPIADRWLEVTVDHARLRPVDREVVTARLMRNLAGFTAPDDGDDHVGLSGLESFLRGAERRLVRGDEIADELFVVAGGVLATTALHADWLTDVGRTLDAPSLRELGRTVERVAYHWTALRITAALTRKGDVSARRLRRRHDEILGATEQALYQTEAVLADL